MFNANVTGKAGDEPVNESKAVTRLTGPTQLNNEETNMMNYTKKGYVRIDEPNSVTPHGRLGISHIGSVSWKAVDDGRQVLKFGLANDVEMTIELSEFYESSRRTVGRDTMIHIDPDEARAIIDHLQGWLDRIEANGSDWDGREIPGTSHAAGYPE